MTAIDIFTARLFNRFDAYYVWDARLGRYDARRKLVTPHLVQAHLNHEITLCVPALSIDGYCLWCAWDSDDDSNNLDKIESVLTLLGWHPLREAKRPGRQGHLWLVFDMPVKAADLRLFDKAMRERASVTLSPDELEFFPKQDTIVKDGMGNGLRLPLGKNRKPDADGAVGWFESCKIKTIESQLDWFALQALNPGKQIAEIAHMIRTEAAARKARRQCKWVTPKNNRIDFIDYAANNGFRRRGEQFNGPCPACRLDSHDNKGDNLSIHATKNLVHCWRGCQFSKIVRAIM